MRLLIPALGRQRKADFYEFQIGLVYIGSYRPSRDTQRFCLKAKEKGEWIIQKEHVHRFHTTKVSSDERARDLAELRLHGNSKNDH